MHTHTHTRIFNHVKNLTKNWRTVFFVFWVRLRDCCAEYSEVRFNFVKMSIRVYSPNIIRKDQYNSYLHFKAFTHRVRRVEVVESVVLAVLKIHFSESHKRISWFRDYRINLLPEQWKAESIVYWPAVSCKIVPNHHYYYYYYYY